MTAADDYLKAGWHPLELPSGTKYPPAEGRTGREGVDMTAEEVAAAPWAGNLGLRMPADVIGLDVDVYHGGDVTLHQLLADHGPLPKTWISHSGRNDGSGIRFYRVPPGMTWVAGLPGIEIIQRGHRYAVVWPSTHPDGRQYGWFDQAEGAPHVGAPLVEDLPELPWPWIAGLSRPDASSAGGRAVGQAAAGAFIDAHEDADAPSYISTIVEHFRERWGQGYARHDTMQHCLIWAMECVRAGIASGRPTVQAFADLWVEAVSPDARRAELWSEFRTTEFEAMLRHAIGRAEAHSQAEMDKLHDDVAGIRFNAPAAAAVVSPGTGPQEGMIDVYQALGLPRPIDWATFAERDEAPAQWLVEHFWPWGRAMALWATAKAGKSELALWCAAKLALGEHPWTGAAVDPIDVAYFDYEMTADDLEDRLAAFGIDVDRLAHLHYWLLPAMEFLDLERGGQQVEALVTQAGVRAVIVDTFGRAVRGDENDADTVRAFAHHTGNRLKRLGVAYLRTDHAGKDPTKGQRGTSAKRDDVDVVWSLKRSDKGVLLDCTGSTRLSWVTPNVALDRVDTGVLVSYSMPVRMSWPPGTHEKAAELDRAGVPLDVTRRRARALLTAAGVVPGKNELLAAALRYRQLPRPKAGDQPPGTKAVDEGQIEQEAT